MNQAIRTVIINGEKWYVAKDVANTIGGINLTNIVCRAKNGRRDKHFRTIHMKDLDDPNDVTSIPNRGLIVCDRVGVARILANSDTAISHKIRRWLVDEVLGGMLE